MKTASCPFTAQDTFFLLSPLYSQGTSKLLRVLYIALSDLVFCPFISIVPP